MSAGDPKFVVLRYTAWLDVAKYQAQGVNIEDRLLGSIVKQYEDPTGGDYLPDNPLQYNEEAFDEKNFTDFIAESSQSMENQGNVSVTSLMGASLKGTAADKAHLNGKLVRMKRLQKHQQFFSNLKNDIQVSRRVPSWMSVLNLQDPVCLVVGIMTCQDVEVSYEGSREMEVNGQVQVPIAEIISSGAGTGVGIGNVANPQVSVARRQDVATVFEGRSGAKTIFAIEVKEVTTKPLHRKSLLLKKHDLNPGSGRWLEDGGDREAEEDLTVDDLILEEVDI